MFRLALFAGLVVYAAAQSPSAPCITALKNIAGNNDATQCLALNSLYPVFTTNDSIIGPFNTWVGAMCGSPRCSNPTLAAVVTNLTSGCSTDFNISSDPTSLIPTVQSLYPTVRRILCLKHGSNLCITETLKNIETVTGPLTLANIQKISDTTLNSLPANVVCTNCNKASYNIWAKDVPSSASTLKPALQAQCNATFVDGSNPPDITQSASDT